MNEAEYPASGGKGYAQSPQPAAAQPAPALQPSAPQPATAPSQPAPVSAARPLPPDIADGPPEPSHAERADHPLQRPAIGLDAHAGFGTPVGYLGVMADVSLSQYFALDAGVGYAAKGPQIAVHGRFRLPVGDGLAFGLGGGVSGGPYASNGNDVFNRGPDSASDLVWDFAFFRNLDVSFELRTPDALQVRLYVGFSGVLNKGAGVCSGHFVDTCLSGPPDFVYSGLSVGHAFFL